MQFKPEMIEAIKAGRKTQTRRPIKDRDFQFWPHPEILEQSHICAVYNKDCRPRWQIGRRYSVCPGRGKNRVALIEIISIWQEPVGQISGDDAHAEGFESRYAFLWAWKRLYPKSDLSEPVWVLEFKLA